MKTTLSWADRFALIDHFKPEDTAVLTAFALTQDELDTARSLRAAGSFGSTANLDVAKYASVFSGAPIVAATASTPTGIVKPSKASGATTHSKPESASKKAKVPQKRGRKGDKIQRALSSVPTAPTAVDAFMLQHGVSLAVLRQSKRFLAKLDAATQATIGEINVRQDKATKQLMIWRSVA